MATIRHSLQKEVFDITEERLVEFLHVTKPGKKKKKISFLCAAINKEKPVYAFIHQVKETDKDSFKKKNSWPLFELQVVDGKDENKETAELDLTIDRVYKWVASSVPEKNSFIQVLWKLCCRYLPKQKPQFINVPPELTQEDSDKNEGKVVIAPGENFCNVNSCLPFSNDSSFQGVSSVSGCNGGDAVNQTLSKKKKRKETVAEQIARTALPFSEVNCRCQDERSQCNASKNTCGVFDLKFHGWQRCSYCHQNRLLNFPFSEIPRERISPESEERKFGLGNERLNGIQVSSQNGSGSMDGGTHFSEGDIPESEAKRLTPFKVTSQNANDNCRGSFLPTSEQISYNSDYPSSSGGDYCVEAEVEEEEEDRIRQAGSDRGKSLAEEVNHFCMEDTGDEKGVDWGTTSHGHSYYNEDEWYLEEEGKHREHLKSENSDYFTLEPLLRDKEHQPQTTDSETFSIGIFECHEEAENPSRKEEANLTFDGNETKYECENGNGEPDVLLEADDCGEEEVEEKEEATEEKNPETEGAEEKPYNNWENETDNKLHKCFMLNVDNLLPEGTGESYSNCDPYYDDEEETDDLYLHPENYYIGDKTVREDWDKMLLELDALDELAALDPYYENELDYEYEYEQQEYDDWEDEWVDDWDQAEEEWDDDEMEQVEQAQWEELLLMDETRQSWLLNRRHG